MSLSLIYCQCLKNLLRSFIDDSLIMDGPEKNWGLLEIMSTVVVELELETSQAC